MRKVLLGTAAWWFVDVPVERVEMSLTYSDGGRVWGGRYHG